MSRLVSCLACARHFRVTETACPFCSAPAADSIAGAAPRPRLEGRPLTRAAILFATATTAAGGLAACGKTTAEPDAGATEYRGPAPPYGIPATDNVPEPPPPPPVDAGADAAPKKKIPVAVPPYGVPATDRKNNPF